MPFPRASKTTPALDRSMMNTINATYQNKQAAARMWSVAGSAPLFNKKIIRKPGAPKPNRAGPTYIKNKQAYQRRSKNTRYQS